MHIANLSNRSNLSKTFIFILLGGILALFSFFMKGEVFAIGGATPPDFNSDFASYLVDAEKAQQDSEHGIETVYDMWISEEFSLKDNIKCMLYPSSYVYTINWTPCSSAGGGKLRDALRYIMVWIVFLFIVIIGIRLLINNPDSDKDDTKRALKSIYYIIIGALLFFWGIWIVDTAINFGQLQGTESLAHNLSSWSDSLVFKLISVVKILVFFIAIVMMVVYWFKIMYAMDKAEEAKKHLKGVTNILVALILIKVVDYIYYVAQLKDFTVKAGDAIISIAKIMWFIIGWGAVLMVFYAWYLFLTDQWSEEKMKQAKNILINILLVGLVIALFLLIIYQVFNEFA